MPRSTASHIELAKKSFRKTLQAKNLETVARDTKFVQRQRVITGTSVFWALIVTVGSHCTQYISDVLRMLNAREGWSIRYKPFWDRLAKAAFPRFMKTMFGHLCRDLATEILRGEKDSDASFFSDVLIDDGSSFAVANGLRKVFPGRFTQISPAAVELHAHMSLCSDQLIAVTLAPDKETERQFLPAAESLPARSLSLRDRGYIDLEYFDALRDRKNGPAYLICRTNDKLNPIVEEIQDASPRFAKKWQGKHLQQLPKSFLRRGADLMVRWPRPAGKSLRVRLVIRYQEQRVSKVRKKKRLTAKEKRYASKKRWVFLLTNLPKRFSADAIARLYRLRWQVELAFKEWKSYANLHALQSEHPAIVEGFIWASLCAALIKRALAHWAQLTHGHPISVRIAAQSGPQLLPRLADWVSGVCAETIFATLLAFLAENARRAHPRRDEHRPQSMLGFGWVTQPVMSLKV
jgi:hypothetical protein